MAYMRVLLIGLVYALCSGGSLADERLWVGATINGSPARFIFDTGADRVLLFRHGAERLGLAITDPPPDAGAPPGTVAIGTTEPCDLGLWGTSARTSLAVAEMPDYVHMHADGVLGWRPLNRNIVSIDARKLTAAFLEKVPEEATNWTRLQIQTNCSYLFLRIPHQDGSEGSILGDTGFPGGVALHPSRWRAWTAAHKNQPMTLDSYFMPGAGVVVKRESWAGQLDFGPLRLTEVPVEEANTAQLALGSSGYEATLGLVALKRLDFIVDGKRGMAYVRLREESPGLYEHNRLGAVFVPSNPDSDDLLASVISGGPAQEAGIRDGDVLLKIGEVDVTTWRTNSTVLPLSRFWTLPAGTKLKLTLRRGAETLSISVRLREILSSAATQVDSGRTHRGSCQDS